MDVLLNVSTDKDPTYRNVGTARPTARPTDRHFFFQAPGDGWYSFVVQTRDADKQLHPPDLRGVPPSIKVCVDTQPPIITLRAVPPKDGSPAAIAWAIQDENFDDLRVDYRSVNGGDWYPLFLPRTPTGEQGFKPAIPGTALELRMQARDKAGNVAVPQSVTVTPVAEKPGMTPPDTGNVMHVRSKTFQLKYQLDNDTVGPSRVASVDIWKARQGGGWQKCRETGTPEGPATVAVESAGRWGFRLIPRSGVGLAERDPRPGDSPDVWVEVDDKAPQVKVTNVAVGQGANSGALTVTWTASDTFLHARPITISYALDPQGPWKEMARDLQNTGSYTCKPQDMNLPFQFHLKVTAIDEAGNVGEDVWRDTVKVDLKVPRIKHIEVKAAEVQAQPASHRPPALPVRPPSGPSETFPGIQR